eukprot:CAMPEP_0184861906 /NCGR_PEP_ID=MMETSP0580-20130426/6487_1 /TAXON_ID=1118495 /ORGANISM="Dactyliosolen fragilissimus" /LENGTH=209 /DNA_ID=CAMNT_0027359573 /DNA_START=101 /DNA_END=730 /DNA_ORIENTATION=-
MSTAASNRKGGKFAKLLERTNANAEQEQKNNVSNEELQKEPEIEIIRHPVFADLDEAEQLVLDLIEVASSTAEIFSKPGYIGGKTEEEINSDGQKLSGLANGLKTSDIIENVRENGKEFLEKVKKVHSLMSPYSNLVIPYKKYSNVSESKSNSDRSNNIYASQVEMRLAMERKDIMEALLQLEKAEEEKHTGDDIDEDNSSTFKRKRED